MCRSLPQAHRRGGWRTHCNLESSLRERPLQEVTHSEGCCPAVKIRPIECIPLSSQDTEDIVPLPGRDAPAHLVPLQFVDDRIFGRGHWKGAPSSLQGSLHHMMQSILVERARLENEDVHFHERFVRNEIKRGAT